MRPDHHIGQVVDPDILAKPAVVADTQAPGKLDPYTRLDAAAPTDPGAKEGKQP